MKLTIRFSLRTLVICVTALCLALGIPTYFIRSTSERQRSALRELRELKVEANYAEEAAAPPWWNREVRKWIDRDAFREVRAVSIPEDVASLERIVSLLPELNGLKQVIVRSPKLTDRDLQAMTGIDMLEELHCAEGLYTSEGIRPLITRFKFIRLHAPSAKFDDGMLATLSRSSELIEVSFDASVATPQGFGHLAPCSKLRTLLLYRVRGLGECLRRTNAMNRLTNVSAGDSEISQDDINEFAKMPKLYLLALNKCRLGEASLEPLTHLQALRILDLRYTTLTPDQLDCLKRFRTLMVMDLHGGVNDDNVDEFLQSPVIRTLSFSRIELSAEGLQKLSGRPTFQYLFLPNDTRCTVDGIRKLQESAAITVGIGDDNGSIIYRPGGIVEDRRKKRSH